ncbi:MAG: polysaccharide biosynthesis/export family protein [Phycisphaerae bacterium]|nr:polysaccharide biosynthesis/export family protein [Phycisphaerae bacterium]
MRRAEAEGGRSIPGRGVRRQAAWVHARSLVSLVGILLTLGCAADTRLSVDAFLAMEQAAAAAATTQPTTRPASATPPVQPYEIGAGDVLELMISGFAEGGQPATYALRVRADGTITLPSVGSVSVAGRTLDAVEGLVYEAYVPQFMRDTLVSARIVEYGTVDVMVLGAVERPSLVALRRDRTSVLQAVVAAGGAKADGVRVTVIPAVCPEQPMEFDLSRPLDLVRAGRVGSLRESDVVAVARRSHDVVYALGLVNHPGPVPMPVGSDLSAMQAIGAAGGTLLAFAPKEATLMRRKDGGETLRVRVDLAGILLGGTPDVPLEPGDLLIVSHTPETRFEEWLANALMVRFGVDAAYNPWTHYYFSQDLDVRRDQMRSGLGNGDFFSTFGKTLLNQIPATAP